MKINYIFNISNLNITIFKRTCAPFLLLFIITASECIVIQDFLSRKNLYIHVPLHALVLIRTPFYVHAECCYSSNNHYMYKVVCVT